MKGMVKRKNNLGILPSQECECLLVFEEIFQADLVVHDGLQAFDAPGSKFNSQDCLRLLGVLLVLDFVPFRVVSEAFVEHREHLERES